MRARAWSCAAVVVLSLAAGCGEEPAPAPPPAPTKPTERDVDAAQATANRFIGPYLAYTTGRVRAAQIPGATQPLIAKLAKRKHYPVVKSGEFVDLPVDRSPGALSLTPYPARPGRIPIVAYVDDDPDNYELTMTVRPVAGRWLVDELAASGDHLARPGGGERYVEPRDVK